MVTQRIQDFIHLEDGRQRLDQQGGLDGAARQVEAIFGITEDFTPPCRFLPCLGLRQIKVRTAAFCQQRFMVVEEIERKVEEAARDSFAAPGHVFFWQMQATDATNQYRRIGLELVDFPGLIGVADGAIHRITQVNLPIDHFIPVR